MLSAARTGIFAPVPEIHKIAMAGGRIGNYSVMFPT
jgi:hypothetical protein